MRINKYSWERLIEAVQASTLVEEINAMYDTISEVKEVFLFGAGSAGCTVYQHLKEKTDVFIRGFIDNDLKKQGSTLKGLPIFGLKNIYDKDAAIVIASTWHKEIKQQLIDNKFTSIFVFPLDFIEWDNFETIKNLKDSGLRNKLKNVYESLADEESKETFIRTLLYRVTYNAEYLNKSCYPQYCHPKINVFDKENIVDGGAYNGDTVKVFKNYFSSISQIISFEPTKNNYNLLNELKKEIACEINLIAVNKALWSEKQQIQFVDTAAAFLIGGNNKIIESRDEAVTEDVVTIEAISLDEYCKENDLRNIDYIKLDIEGAEVEALKGSLSTIKSYKPVLAICIYHKSNHYWEVFDIINDLELGYNFYLGHHSDWMLETVLYAIP